jgi:hypothetical protein
MCPGHERWHPTLPSTTKKGVDRCSTWDPTISPSL